MQPNGIFQTIFPEQFDELQSDALTQLQWALAQPDKRSVDVADLNETGALAYETRQGGSLDWQLSFNGESPSSPDGYGEAATSSQSAVEETNQNAGGGDAGLASDAGKTEGFERTSTFNVDLVSNSPSNNAAGQYTQHQSSPIYETGDDVEWTMANFTDLNQLDALSHQKHKFSTSTTESNYVLHRGELVLTDQYDTHDLRLYYAHKIDNDLRYPDYYIFAVPVILTLAENTAQTVNVGNIASYDTGEGVVDIDVTDYNLLIRDHEAGPGNLNHSIGIEKNNVHVEGGAGDNRVHSFGDNVEITYTGGDNSITFDGANNNSIESENGNNLVYIIGGSGNSVNLTDGDNAVYIYGGTNHNIVSGTGDDFVEFIPDSKWSDTSITLEGGANRVEIGATTVTDLSVGSDGSVIVWGEGGGLSGLRLVAHGDNASIISYEGGAVYCYGENAEYIVYDTAFIFELNEKTDSIIIDTSHYNINDTSDVTIQQHRDYNFKWSLIVDGTHIVNFETEGQKTNFSKQDLISNLIFVDEVDVDNYTYGMYSDDFSI